MARVRSPRPSGRAEERRARGGQGHCKMALLRELTRSGCLNAENAVNEVSSGALPLEPVWCATLSGAYGPANLAIWLGANRIDTGGIERSCNDAREPKARIHKCRLALSTTPLPEVARSEAQGRVQWGPPFLWLLSFGGAKESYCAAGRTSRHTAST